ncbi:uncharacterized protein PG998_003126 [Apiospora kogelbergensis]|uniref:uncharacterized protein n=1 Tax=Apiospora kogelbergensis TaxID=1337665 RepID=UPI0031309EC9
MATAVNSGTLHGAEATQSPEQAQLQVTEGHPLIGHDIEATLNYYLEPGDDSPPTPVVVSPGQVTNERPTIAVPATIQDITGRDGLYTLDSHGFQLHHHESSEKLFLDEGTIKTVYFDETEQLLKDVTGAAGARIFDHKVRRGPAHWHQLGENNKASRGPLHRVHVDQSYNGAEIILQRHFPDQVDELKARRWQIINVWRPIKTVYQNPLAVADARSVSEDCLIAAEVLYESSGQRSETWAVKPPPSGTHGQHRWYYKHAQRPDEVMLIKCFDSDVANEARRTPHSAFEIPPASPDSQNNEGDGKDDAANRSGRESIEVRALVFY